MKLRHRRLYFVTMIALFFVLAVIIIGYALGWRYIPARQSLEKVSAIAVSTEPDNARLYLDGVMVDDTTPLSINNLIAGSYELRIEKSGYQPWHKTVRAYTNSVTRLADIRLLHQFDLNRITPDRTDQLTSSPRGSYITVYRDTELTIYLSGSDVPVVTQRIPAAPTAIQWSRDEQYALLSFAESPSLVLGVTGTVYRLSELVPENLMSFRWSSVEPTVLYGWDDSQLYRINVQQSTSTVLDDRAGQIYFTDELFLLPSTTTTLIMDESNTERATLPVPPTHQIEVVPGHDTIHPFIDSTDKHLYVYVPDRSAIQHIAPYVRAASWNTDTTALLYYSDNELWIWSADTDDTTLILRTSETIRSAHWAADNAYIVYRTAQTDGLRWIETSGIDANTYQLDTTLTEYAISENGNRLYVATDDGIFTTPL